MGVLPYRTTPVFDQNTLPAALRREHRTKAGVWGIIRILKGELLLERAAGQAEMLDALRPGAIEPEEPHFVTLLGPVQMQLQFYDRPPGECP